MAYIRYSRQDLYSSGSTTKITLPGHKTDDLLIVWLTQDVGTTAISTSSTGWTIISGQGAATILQAIAYKIATSASEADPVFSGTNTQWSVVSASIVDADTITPIHASAKSDWVAATVTSPALTTTVDECLIFYSFGADGSSGFLASLASYAQKLGEMNSSTEHALVCWKQQKTAGLVPSVVATCKVSYEGGNAWTVAVKNKTNGATRGTTSPTYSIIKQGGVIDPWPTQAAPSTVAASIGGISTDTVVRWSDADVAHSQIGWGVIANSFLGVVSTLPTT